MMDTHSLRRYLRRIHKDLRNEGLNPVEALGVLRERLMQVDGAPDDGKLSFDIEAADLLAILYQEVLVAEARNGLGQYLTPLPVADAIATLVSSEVSPDTVLDPFCGVGLLLDRVGAIAPTAELKGVEINQPVAEMAATLAEMAGRPAQVVSGDAFAIHLDGLMPQADAVVSNPPFGAMASSIEPNHPGIPSALARMGHIPAELLGLEVCVDALRPGGRLAIVLPHSVLTNRGWSAYRAHIFRKLKLTAVVSLPEETFAPFRGVASACIVVGHREDAVGFPYACRYFVSKSVGYTATGRAAGSCDLDDIAKRVVLGEESDRILSLTEGGDAVLEQKETSQGGIRLGDVADVFVGKNPPATQYRSNGPWLLKVGDLAGGVLPWRSREKNRVSEEWFAKEAPIHLQLGDVCLTAAGHRPKYIGLKVDVVDHLPPEGAAPSGEVMVVRLKDGVDLQPEHLLYFLRSPAGYGFVQDLVRGSTGHLYSRDLVELLVPDLNLLVPIAAIEAHRKAAAAFREYRTWEETAAQLANPGS